MSDENRSPDGPHTAGGILRIGNVSFLNARPLVWGLEKQTDLAIFDDVPSRLLAGLEAGRFDVALLPAIDYQRRTWLRIVAAGGIGCDGPTLTVRIFSHVPLEQIRTLACDTDSRTSVALARILLAEQCGVRPGILDLDAAEAGRCDARLLIGDKVVCGSHGRYEHEFDLGVLWKKHTGLPFLFAVWMTRDGRDLRDLAARLRLAREEGIRNVDRIVSRDARRLGWPDALARRYLTTWMKYDVGEPQLRAMELFHSLAAKHGLLEGAPRPLEHYAPPAAVSAARPTACA